MAENTRQGPSLISALHSRYEAIQAEYQPIEKAEYELSDEPSDGEIGQQLARFRSAIKTLCEEEDAVRNAILFQVPDSQSDALILQYHIVCAADLYAGAPEQNEADNRRLQLAIETLFDFMSCEIETEGQTVPSAIGATLAASATRVFNARRLRTGVVEA